MSDRRKWFRAFRQCASVHNGLRCKLRADHPKDGSMPVHRCGRDEWMEPPLCAVDRNGKKYTTAVAASTGDWWMGATILHPGMVHYLERDGLLPLREVNPYTGELISVEQS